MNLQKTQSIIVEGFRNPIVQRHCWRVSNPEFYAVVYLISGLETITTNVNLEN